MDKPNRRSPDSKGSAPASSTRRRFYMYSRRTIWISALCLTGVLVAGLLFWNEQRRLGSDPSLPSDASMERQELAGAHLATAQVSVFFRQAGAPALTALTRDIFVAASPEVRGRQLVQALIEGPRAAEAASVVPVLPKETKLRQIYLLADGTAVVDLSEEVANLLPGGIDSEMMAVESIRRTLLENVPEFKSVRFLINGKEERTFAGHLIM